MKTKLPFIAAALLLTTAPALADDLLDAVLWDGPSAFPDKPAPAPTVPSAPFVPSIPPPATLPAPQPAPPPSASDPVPVSGEAQIRQEIQEMRARADRLEAALGPGTPDSGKALAEAAPSAPDWLSRPRLSLRGGGRRGRSGDDGSALSGELVFPIAKTPFDASLRGFWVRNDYQNYKDGHDDDEMIQNYGLEAWGMWLPLRKAVFSPYAGVGLRHETIDGALHRAYYGRHELDKDPDDHGFFVAGRVGATVTYKRLMLRGEFIGASKCYELVGELALRLTDRIVLTGFAEHFDNDFPEGDPIVFGGGLTILFGHAPQP